MASRLASDTPYTPVPASSADAAAADAVESATDGVGALRTGGGSEPETDFHDSSEPVPDPRVYNKIRDNWSAAPNAMPELLR